MPEHEKPSLLETLIRGIAERALGGLSRYAEQIMKRLLRLAGLYISGAVVVLLGVAFLAVGAVNWFTLIVDKWLAWTIIGTVLTLAALLVSRS